jgi:hypothetical protein
MQADFMIILGNRCHYDHILSCELMVNLKLNVFCVNCTDEGLNTCSFATSILHALCSKQKYCAKLVLNVSTGVSQG